ncbi:MAG TPA: hypothetical protein VG496_02945 [Myxococcales bacterium]|nr:hypothetical protein [Myxococcales bacterium]
MTVVLEFGRWVETVKVAVVAPAATVTDEGTVATDVLLLDSDTAAPPVGAPPVSVTVPFEVLPPRTLVGFNVSDESATDPPPPPHTFGVPPPPHVCGAVQAPQLSVPPQPSGIEPQFFPCCTQLVTPQGAVM